MGLASLLFAINCASSLFFNLKVFVMDIYEKLLKCASVLVMLCSIFSAAARNFIHPGLLHSQDDLKRITRLVKRIPIRLWVRMIY